MSVELYIPALILVPFLLSVAVRYAGKAGTGFRDLLVRISGLIELGLAVLLLINVIRLQTLVFSFRLCGQLLTFRADGFRGIYTLIACFMWAMTLLFSPGYFAHYHNRSRYYFFNLLTLGATVGVFLSDDLFTTFVFFEIMSFASYPWVAHEENPGAMRAAQTYLAVAVLGGMVTLMGLFLLAPMAGTLSFEGLRAWAGTVPAEKLYLPGALILFGFAAKAGMFPMHIWLPKAHPVAPAPASALLSGILTKTGVFGILVVCCNLFGTSEAWGNVMLLLGVITMLLGAILAIFSIDLKRTLACSSMSQIGFIAVGVAMSCILGEENALAARGTVLHMVNHSLLKLDLFMCAGVIYMNLHQLDLNRIRGFGRRKPLLNFCFLMGCVGIMGVPLFNGFLSKSLLHEAILEGVAESAEYGSLYTVVEKLFLLAGGMTAAYMTKLYVCIFIQKNRDPERQQQFDAKKDYLPLSGRIALTLSAVLLPVLGMFPDLIMKQIGDLSASFLHAAHMEHAIHWFSGENLEGAAISLGAGALLYCLIRLWLVKNGDYINRWPAKLDLENSGYRPLINRVLTPVGALLGTIADRVLDNPLVLKVFPALVTFVTRCFEKSTDGSVLMLRNTVFRKLENERQQISLSDHLLLKTGSLINRITGCFGKKDRSEKTDYVAWLMALKTENPRMNRYITRSVSFGLLLLAVTLMFVLIYLVFIHG